MSLENKILFCLTDSQHFLLHECEETGLKIQKAEGKYVVQSLELKYTVKEQEVFCIKNKHFAIIPKNFSLIFLIPGIYTSSWAPYLHESFSSFLASLVRLYFRLSLKSLLKIHIFILLSFSAILSTTGVYFLNWNPLLELVKTRSQKEILEEYLLGPSLKKVSFDLSSLEGLIPQEKQSLLEENQEVVQETLPLPPPLPRRKPIRVVHSPSTSPQECSSFVLKYLGDHHPLRQKCESRHSQP